MVTGIPKTKPSKLVVAQKPNVSISVAVVAYIAYRIVDAAWLSDLAYALFVVALGFWATQEVTSGVNWFRKALGLFALAMVALSVFKQIHA
jgi:uncharacterized transporter YbjL